MLHYAIHGVPRSGTSWLGEIVNSSPHTRHRFQPLFSYAMKGRLTPTSSSKEIARFFDDLLSIEDDFLCQTEGRLSGRLPIFKKSQPTHVGYKEVRYHHILPNLLEQFPGIRLLLLTRGPLATLASWLSAPREFRRDLGWKIEEEWQHAPSKNLGKPEEFNGYEKWKEATLLFESLAAHHPDQVLTIRYETLTTFPLASVTRIFSFLGLPLHSQTIDFVSNQVENDDPYSVFRANGQAGSARAILTHEIESQIREDLADHPLASYLDPE